MAGQNKLLICHGHVFNRPDVAGAGVQKASSKILKRSPAKPFNTIKLNFHKLFQPLKYFKTKKNKYIYIYIYITLVWIIVGET